MKYKVGDRVRITTEKKGYLWNCSGKMDKWLGKVMTIRDVCERCYQMQEDLGEHRGGGWLWFEEMIDGLADEQKIVITTDGKTTTAKLYDGKKFIKEAVAKCAPEDEFDFKTGAELAFKRLFEEEGQQGFTGRAVYIRGSDWIMGRTNGKIYSFHNGFYVDDNGVKRPTGGRGFTKFEISYDGFLPIKE